MEQQDSLATRLKYHRAAAGLTQAYLAERANMSVRGLSNLERGLNRAPRPETLERLMDALALMAEERRLLRVIARATARQERTGEAEREQVCAALPGEHTLSGLPHAAPAAEASRRGLALLRRGAPPRARPRSSAPAASR